MRRGRVVSAGDLPFGDGSLIDTGGAILVRTADTDDYCRLRIPDTNCDHGLPEPVAKADNTETEPERWNVDGTVELIGGSSWRFGHPDAITLAYTCFEQNFQIEAVIGLPADPAWGSGPGVGSPHGQSVEALMVRVGNYAAGVGYLRYVPGLADEGGWNCSAAAQTRRVLFYRTPGWNYTWPTESVGNRIRMRLARSGGSINIEWYDADSGNFIALHGTSGMATGLIAVGVAVERATIGPNGGCNAPGPLSGWEADLEELSTISGHPTSYTTSTDVVDGGEAKKCFCTVPALGNAGTVTVSMRGANSMFAAGDPSPAWSVVAPIDGEYRLAGDPAFRYWQLRCQVGLATSVRPRPGVVLDRTELHFPVTGDGVLDRRSDVVHVGSQQLVIVSLRCAHHNPNEPPVIGFRPLGASPIPLRSFNVTPEGYTLEWEEETVVYPAPLYQYVFCSPLPLLE